MPSLQGARKRDRSLVTGSRAHLRTVVRTAARACVLVLLLQAAGCVAIQDQDDEDIMLPPIAAKPTPVPQHENPGIPDIFIVDMHEEPASSPSLVKVVGTVVNRSNQDAYRLTVRVEARDAQGRALTRVNAPTLAETIPAAGGTTTFEASMPRSATIHDFHAELIAH